MRAAGAHPDRACTCPESSRFLCIQTRVQGAYSQDRRGTGQQESWSLALHGTTLTDPRVERWFLATRGTVP